LDIHEKVCLTEKTTFQGGKQYSFLRVVKQELRFYEGSIAYQIKIFSHDETKKVTIFTYQMVAPPSSLKKTDILIIYIIF
jgi:hypothetical protein